MNVRHCAHCSANETHLGKLVQRRSCAVLRHKAPDCSNSTEHTLLPSVHCPLRPQVLAARDSFQVCLELLAAAQASPSNRQDPLPNGHPSSPSKPHAIPHSHQPLHTLLQQLPGCSQLQPPHAKVVEARIRSLEVFRTMATAEALAAAKQHGQVVELLHGVAFPRGGPGQRGRRGHGERDGEQPAGVREEGGVEAGEDGGEGGAEELPCAEEGGGGESRMPPWPFALGSALRRPPA